MGKCNDIWNGKDKLKHFIISFAIATFNPIIGLLVGIGKEIYDVIQANNHFCWKDVIFDIAGIICGSILHLMILLFIC